MKKMINNVISFIIGWCRYFLYYTLDGKFIRPHILEQIRMRIKSMNQECYFRGSCIKCGCATTALQMANKACEGKCYPKMLGKKQWKKFKQSEITEIADVIWLIENDKFIKVEEDEL